MARHYDLCMKYAALGKNRLLELIRLLKKENISDLELLERYPFPDITEDEGGILFSRHVDSITTLHRLHVAGVDFATFEDAKLIASYLKEPMKVIMAKKLFNKLNKISEDEATQKEAFDTWLTNKMSFPGEMQEPSPGVRDINQVLADYINVCTLDKINDSEWISYQSKILTEDIFLEAHRLMHMLADKININLNPLQ